jgi:hypothetical protein
MYFAGRQARAGDAAHRGAIGRARTMTLPGRGTAGTLLVGGSRGGFSRGGFSRGSFSRGGFSRGGFSRGSFSRGGFRRGRAVFPRGRVLRFGRPWFWGRGWRGWYRPFWPNYYGFYWPPSFSSFPGSFGYDFPSYYCYYPYFSGLGAGFAVTSPYLDSAPGYQDYYGAPYTPGIIRDDGAVPGEKEKKRRKTQDEDDNNPDDGTYKYDGGPADPVPLPGARPAPERKKPPAEEKREAFRRTGLSYPAYGEPAGPPLLAGKDRTLAVKRPATKDVEP